MNDYNIFPKTLYVSVLRSDLEAIKAERDALKAEVQGLKNALREQGVAVDLPKMLHAG